MFLSELSEFPLVPSLTGKETWWQLASLCCWTGWQQSSSFYRGADKSLARPGRKQVNVSVRMAWTSFGALPCRKKKLKTARVWMLLKSRASLKYFRTCFLPGWAKDLSATLLYVEGSWNLIAHAKKPDFVFWRNGRVHLNRPGGVSSVDYWQPRCAHWR